MNIVLVHYSAPPVVGGVESVLQNHARLMVDAGHQVRVLAGRGAQVDERIPFVCVPLADSIHPDVLEVKGELDRGRLSPKFYELVDKISTALQEQTAGTDVLLAHNVCSLHKNLALTAAIRSLMKQPHPPRLILWHHDLAWMSPRYLPNLHPGYPWDLLRTSIPAAIHVAVSELRRYELAELMDIRPEGIAVIPGGIDMARFLKLSTKTLAMIKPTKLFSFVPVLLLPVRITPRKNIELALQVLAQLRSHYPQAALIVTGPPGAHNPENAGYFDQLRALREELGLHDAVYFLAEISGEVLPDEVIGDFYRLADALFLPSREEGFGIPILEAGLSGLPIFCTDLPPLRQMAGDQASYFPPDADPGRIADMIYKRLSSDPGFILRSRVRQQFTWEKIYADLIAPLLIKP